MEDDVAAARRMDKVRVLLKTSRRPLLQHMVKVHIKGEVYRVYIAEEGGGENPDRTQWRSWGGYGSSEEIESFESDKEDDCSSMLRLEQEGVISPAPSALVFTRCVSQVERESPTLREAWRDRKWKTSPSSRCGARCNLRSILSARCCLSWPLPMRLRTCMKRSWLRQNMARRTCMRSRRRANRTSRQQGFLRPPRDHRCNWLGLYPTGVPNPTSSWTNLVPWRPPSQQLLCTVGLVTQL